MHPRVAGWLNVGIAVVVCLCLGCAEPTYPVRGQVVYKESKQPVTGINVWFESTSPPHQRSSATVNEKGEFSLATVEVDSGAIAGEHIVRLEPMYAGPWRDVAEFTDPKYGDYITTPLKFTIEPGKDNNFLIEIDPPAKKK